MINVLPHGQLFTFVDRVELSSQDKFTTLKDTSFVEELICTKDLPDGYPVCLMIEHCAQTMFIHGYYIGLHRGWWDSDYKPIGLLTEISNFKFLTNYIPIGQKLKTETILKKVRPNIIFIDTVVTLDGNVLAEGGAKGVFLKEHNVKVTDDELSYSASNCKDKNFHFYKKSGETTSFESTYWFLPHHFPEFPCIPGCLLLEGFAQSLGRDVIRSIKKVRFRKAATPDQEYKYRILSISSEENEYRFEIVGTKTNECHIEGYLSV